jgi:intracellular septation protein
LIAPWPFQRAAGGFSHCAGEVSFFALALLNEIVWRTQSNDVSVAFKFPRMLILIFLFSMAQVPFILRHKLPDEDAERAPEHY